MPKQTFVLRFLLLAMIVILCCETGCVRRRMNIRAFQEGNTLVPITGAMVYVNKQPVGRTPVSCNFSHYGTMEFTVIKEGYEPLSEYRKIRAPWYQWPGIDFFSEVVWPQEITDTKRLDFQLKPERIITQDELVDRAEAMRRESQANATFRTESGTTTGIINPITTPAGSMTGDPNMGGSIVSPSDASGTTRPIGAGSIGVPSTPFSNPLIYQNPTIGQ